mmetsp:Transcript_18369/g.37249  ORF Transcript_18369/g.37249 Transcript_18369/m.37249 type:complete len:231 (+) Transcript_18369:732-1424(+)
MHVGHAAHSEVLGDDGVEFVALPENLLLLVERVQTLVSQDVLDVSEDRVATLDLLPRERPQRHLVEVDLHFHHRFLHHFHVKDKLDERGDLGGESRGLPPLLLLPPAPLLRCVLRSCCGADAELHDGKLPWPLLKCIRAPVAPSVASLFGEDALELSDAGRLVHRIQPVVLDLRPNAPPLFEEVGGSSSVALDHLEHVERVVALREVRAVQRGAEHLTPFLQHMRIISEP